MTGTPKGKENGTDNKTAAIAAQQLRRAKLIKAKIVARAQGSAGGPGDKVSPNLANRFQNTASGSTARKNRKGFRPG